LTNYPSNPLFGGDFRRKMSKAGLRRLVFPVLAFIVAGSLAAAAQTPYQPKFPGDPARSDAEAQALGYMRVVVRAQKTYKKRHDKYATSLLQLAGTESFTKRMAKTTERGDYSVGFRSQKDGYMLTATPKQVDTEHRSFYAEEDGAIHADDQKAADQNSPRIK
jgi:hypothetical protein